MPGPRFEIQENVALAPFTTLGIGGPARFFSEIRSESHLVAAFDFARANHLATFVLGGGSNLLVSDAGFSGLVLHLVLEFPMETSHGPRHVNLRVPAGLDWDTLVLQTCGAGLSGMECLAGIPGLVGGSPVQNIGAYGQEVAQTIYSVRAFDVRTLAFTELSEEACGFGYRTSVFNSTARGRYVITAVKFRLSRDSKPNLTYAELAGRFAGQQPRPLEVYEAVREIRRSKGMLLTPGDPDCRSAGSFFKNPVISAEHFARIARMAELEPSQVPHWPTALSSGVSGVKLAAAWLIEQSGFGKGYSLGEAGISSRHTLALINRGHATYADLISLRDRIRSGVSKRFDIRLEQEPVELGS